MNLKVFCIFFWDLVWICFFVEDKCLECKSRFFLKGNVYKKLSDVY